MTWVTVLYVVAVVSILLMRASIAAVCSGHFMCHIDWFPWVVNTSDM